jgi:type I restriction enzyme S subunit
MSNFQYLKIGTLFNVEKGILQSSKNIEGKYDFITASVKFKKHIEYSHECEALIFAMGAAGSLGRTHYINGKFIASDLCFILTPSKKYQGKINFKLYHKFFNFIRSDIVNKTATGTSKLAINATNFSNYEIPYYDFDYQQRVQNLISKIQSQKETLCLEFEKQKDYLTRFSQAILQEAVQGKLAPQDPNGEPASELLKRIKAEKEKLIAEGKLKKQKPLPTITEDEIPYELPQCWEWSRLGELAKQIEYGTSQRASRLNLGIPILRMNNINNGKISYDNLKYVDDNIKDLPRLHLKHNDILFNRTNSYELVGKTGIFKEQNSEFTFASYLIRVSLFQDFILPDYVNLVLCSKYFRQYQIEPEITQQCGQANFNGTKLKYSILPLPPLTEQKCIVIKVDQLMHLCDELETRLNQSQKDSEMLMQAVLQEAF